MCHRSAFLRIAVLVAAFAIIDLETPALGQENLDDTRAPTQERSETVIDETIVTATRREAELRTVPLSVSVATAEQLERLGATGFSGYARTVPRLHFVDPGYGGESRQSAVSP